MIGRYIMVPQQNHKENLSRAFALYKELGIGKNLILHIPSYNQLDLGTIIFEVLGKNVCEALKNKQNVRLSATQILSVVTDRTFDVRYTQDVIMTVYPSAKGIALINDTTNAHAIIVVPWTMNEEVIKWQRAWTPTVVGASNGANARLNIDPVIESVLRRLTNSVNLATGLAHPSDRDSAIELFQLLRRKGYTYDSSIIEIWAIRNGWSSSGAKELAQMAKEITNGKKLRTSGRGPMWREDILDRIRSELD